MLSCLERGENVMIHCLAGAHRAGTGAVSFMMRQSGLSYEDARKVARKCRPVIDPYGQLEGLLHSLEKAADEIKPVEDTSVSQIDLKITVDFEKNKLTIEGDGTFFEVDCADLLSKSRDELAIYV
jgi:hypothetical protein